MTREPTIKAAPGQKRHRGFSIVEVMVGLAIGMLGVVIMMQVFAVSEGQKRTTTSGTDAQANGVIALNTMERDLRMAGYGMSNSTVFGAGGCTSIKWYFDGAAKPDRALAPVTIVDGGTGGSDTITMTFSNAMLGTTPATITKDMPQPSAELDLDRVAGFEAGNLFIVAQSGVCVLMQATHVQANPNKLQHNSGASGPYNPAAADIPASWPTFTQGAQVFNMGQMASRQYSVASANLQVLEMPSATPLVLTSNIVNIQAQYGIADAGSQVVNCWVNATTGNTCDASDWSAPTSAMVARIKAVRIAVVARSAQPEKPDTAGNCSTTTTAPVSWSGGPAVSLTGDAQWKCYRYKVFQTIVPLRNVIWAAL